MDITVYLPDELGQRAKADQNVNLSRILRDALEQRFHEEDTMTRTLEGAQEHKLTLENKEGQSYIGTIIGKKIAASDRVEVFLTDEQNVVVYDIEKADYSVEDGQVDLEDLIGDQDAYIEAMAALGRQAVVELQI